MDFGKGFVAAVLAGGKDAYRQVVLRNIKPDYLVGDGRIALDCVVEHVAKYRQIPSREIVVAKSGVDVGLPDAPIEFYIDECLVLKLHTILKENMFRASSALENNDPKQCWDQIKVLYDEVHRSQTTFSPARSLFDLIPEVEALYDKIKAGFRGIPLPFPTMNDMTLGIWPQDLALFVARTGVGKTWTLLLLAKAAWDAGYRILVCTTEMSQLRIAQRFLAIKLGLHYPEFRSGKLDLFEEDAMRASFKKLLSEDDQRLKVLGGDFDFSIDGLQAEMDNFMPDIVIADGIYLIESDGDNRQEKIANTANMLKRTANRTGVPFAISSQFNRNTKKDDPKTVATENIGLSDALGWNADIGFGMIQTEDMIKENRMILKPIKIREGKPVEIECIWDIDNMVFQEIPQTPSGFAASRPAQLGPPAYDPNDPQGSF